METIQSLSARLTLTSVSHSISLASQSAIPPPGLYSESFIPTPVKYSWKNTSPSPLSSLVGAGFFFVEKKYKTLCSCIDFRGLNITGMNKYCLPLFDSAFDSALIQCLYCWTRTMPITWSTSRRVMNGRRDLTPL